MPLQITFRNVTRSNAIETAINEKAEKMNTFFERIMSCRVVVEESQRRHHQGKLFRIGIDITVPGKELAVSREENQDVYVAIRDAFDAAYRQLEEHGRRRHGVVKSHAVAPQGRVLRIFPDENYGFIETDDKREVYFHRNSVLNDEFKKLSVGAEVGFIEEQGKEGPQAARVTLSKP